MHRGLLSRVFTPKKMNAIEPKVREFCARTLDPLRDEDRFDFIADLGAQMPMRTIGYLLGIPEQLFERAAKDYAEIEYRGYSKNRLIGKRAEMELFEIRRLAVGMVAPEIEGKDIDGTPFKLSDYRGKVVLLDFWGHW